MRGQEGWQPGRDSSSDTHPAAGGCRAATPRRHPPTCLAPQPTCASRSATASRKCSLERKMASLLLPTRPEGTELRQGRAEGQQSSGASALHDVQVPQVSRGCAPPSSRRMPPASRYLEAARPSPPCCCPSACPPTLQSPASPPGTHVKKGDPPSMVGSSMREGGRRYISTSWGRANWGGRGASWSGVQVEQEHEQAATPSTCCCC